MKVTVHLYISVIPTFYSSLVGDFQYLKFTRHDIFYTVYEVGLYIHDSLKLHMNALKHIFMCHKETVCLSHRLLMRSSTVDYLVSYTHILMLTREKFSNRWSTYGFFVFLKNNFVSLSVTDLGQKLRGI